MAFQSLTQMMSVWSKEDADSLIEMVGAIAVLSARGETTTKLVTGWAGTYEKEKISTNYGGTNDGSYSLSYEEKNILDPADLMKLKKKKEVVLFLDGEFCMGSVPEAQYFNIEKLNKISKACLAEHLKIERRANKTQEVK